MITLRIKLETKRRFYPSLDNELRLDIDCFEFSEMSQLSVIVEHIEITPDVYGGKPRIAGHRIKVQDIIILSERIGMSPDEILFQYPSITLSNVYAALAYYHDHLEEIRQQIQENEALARELQAKNPSLVQQKFKDIDGRKD